MKAIKLIIVLGILFNVLNSYAQQVTDQSIKPILPQQLGVTYSKTTNIIFPQAIISVDRGSRDILAQKAKGVENILQVKAARDSFPQTNLTVVTADGRLSSFLVNYEGDPQILNLSISKAASTDKITLSPDNRNLADIDKFAAITLRSRDIGRSVNDESSGIRLRVGGFFIQDDIIYCRLQVVNETNIGYDIDQLRFFVRDQKKVNRTATQEVEIVPVSVKNNTEKIKPLSEQTMVFALPKFTIPDKKYLAVQMMEKNGGRNLEVSVKNKIIIKASPLQ